MPLAVGLMSGTSIDGIDAALVRVSGRGDHIKLRLVDFTIYPFPPGLTEKILDVSHPRTARSDEICRLNLQLGELFAEAAKRLCRKNRLPLSRISFIGSHGQTIVHLGRRGTFQIGEPCVIAERTGITTVADFRPRDIAAGGEGAPLAPYFHYLLFRHPRRPIAVHNLGGISNLTFIPAGASPDRVIGFDTGPANMVIDGVIRKISKGKIPYDHGGRLAAKGMVSLKLLKELLGHPFVRTPPPKTAGREEFGREFVDRIVRRGWALGLNYWDLVATVTAWTAGSVAENYRRFIFPKAVPYEIIFGGGGVRNLTLMRMIRQELAGIRIRTFHQAKAISADAAEAVCFAVLAYKTLLGEPANLPSVTGASHPVVLGKIVPGKKLWKARLDLPTIVGKIGS